MKGLELSERFYLEYGAPMIHEKFPELESILAIGLMGSGSECFGYDDEISQDHDFEPGFCIFLPDEDIIDSRTSFSLERAYSKLPREFMGYQRNLYSPVGGSRHGVIRTSDFFRDKTGTSDGILSIREWFSLSEQLLAEATNGKIFRDDFGLLTSIRERLSYLPETRPATAAASIPCIPPVQGTITLFTFFMIFPLNSILRDAGISPSISRTIAPAYAIEIGSVQPIAG